MSGGKSLLENYRGVFDGKVGFGQSPVIIVIDFVRAYTTVGSPLYAADVSNAVLETSGLMRLARSKNIPVIFTKVCYHASLLDGGLFVKKIPVLKTLIPGEPMGEIVQELRPGAEELVITKQYASAFFATHLSSTLQAMGCDTLILTGCSTSGCVRATAVDGMQHGYRVIVPRECVADRSIEPHESNLFDIDSKYGDVVAKAAVVNYLEELR